MTKRLTTVLVAMVLALAACSGAATPPGSTTTGAGPDDTAATVDGGSEGDVVVLKPAESEPTTAWDQAIADLENVIPLQTAIDAFSVVFGPIDGATPTDLEPGFAGSGSGPLRWILGHWDDLSPTQQAQVEDVLASWEGGPSAFAPPVQAGFLLSGRLNFEQDPQTLVTDVVGSLEALLERSITIPITVEVAPPFAVGLKEVDGLTLARDAGGGFTGPAASCTITFRSDVLAYAEAEAVNVAAHEAFHCFEADLGTLKQSYARPAWIVEGMAEWAGATVAGGAASESWIWADWLDNHVYRQLFSRVYDAIGFYSHVDDNGVDLWSRIDSAIVASDTSSETAYQVLVDSPGTEMVDSWSAGSYRDLNDAPLWDQDGPGITPEAPDIPQNALGNETAFGLGASPYSVSFGDFDATAEVITFESPGAGLAMLADGTTHRLADLHGSALCTTGSCSCPEGTPGAGVVFTPTPQGVIRVAPTGHTSGSDVVVVGWSLERFCHRERCQVGTWRSTNWHGYRILFGGDGGQLYITRDGEGYIDWSQADDLASFAIGGTLTSGLEPVPLKFELDGASHFQGEYVGIVFKVTSVAGTLQLTPYVDLGDGWIETTGVGGVSLSGGTGPTATFACSGDTLLLNGAVEFTRVSEDATIPESADDLTPTTATGGDGGGTGPAATGPPPSVDPCTLLTLEEVKSIDPNATQPTGADDPGNPFLTQCTFSPSMSLQVYGTLGPDFFSEGADMLGYTMVDIPGIGDWAIAQISPADPQLSIAEGVALVAAGSDAGTVVLIPWRTVPPDGPLFEHLKQLLELGLGRL